MKISVLEKSLVLLNRIQPTSLCELMMNPVRMLSGDLCSGSSQVAPLQGSL